MFSSETLRELLQMDDGWDPSEVEYSKTTGTLTVAVDTNPSFWHRQICPSCRGRNVGPGDCGKLQTWRHLDGFNVKTLIECSLPKAKCTDCSREFSVKPNWQGRSRHFTKGFEAFALSVIQETTVRRASKVLCESDQRLWRMLFAYVEAANAELSTVAISILHREWNTTGQR